MYNRSKASKMGKIATSCPCVPLFSYLIEHAGRHADHGKVVNDEHRLRLTGCLSHQLGAHPYEEQVAHEDAGDWHR